MPFLAGHCQLPLRLWLGALWLLHAWAPAAVYGQADPENATAPAEPVVLAPAPPAPPALPRGDVHVLVFAADTPAAGAALSVAGGEVAITGPGGTATLSLPAGEHTLELHWPADGPPSAIPGVMVASGQTTQVIVTVGPDGALLLDIMAPEGATVAAAESAAAPVATGTVTGVVVSDEGGEPVAGARVYAAGQSVDAVTDASGRFTVVLPVGTHTLSVLHTKYSTQTRGDVVVTAEATTDVDIALTPASIELEEFVISAPHVSGGVASLMAERQQSAAVSDAISAEDIARMPASNAAQAAQRIVGATIVGGRFVYVRGLGERYSNALLNGAPLPSPEPDRATVPLDLFPSQILQSLDISKTFTPDVPGDFAGGSVRIITKSVPEDRLLSAGLSVGLNSASSFEDYYGQTGAGAYDFLGLTNDKRALPSDVPRDYALGQTSTKPDGDRVKLGERRTLSDAINTDLHLKRRTMGPDTSATVALGDGWKLGGDNRIGALASLTHGTKYRLRKGTRTDFEYLQEADITQARNTYDVETATEAVQWGAFSSAALELGKRHTISLLGMHSQLADKRTGVNQGYNGQIQHTIARLHQDYLVRGLSNAQLQGRHVLSSLREAELKWLGSYAVAGRDEDDTRDVVFKQSEEQWVFNDAPDSARHFYSDQSEIAKVAGLDWTQPIVEGPVSFKAKLGALVSFKDRDFAARFFSLREDRGTDLPGCGETFEPTTCPRDLFTTAVVGQDVVLVEGTTDKSAYWAQLNVRAAYLMGELGFGEEWRFIGGARVEHTLQRIQAYNQYSGEDIEDEGYGAKLQQADVLPAASVVYSPIEDGAIRVALSQTLARPQLRELAPFAYENYETGQTENGNPELKLTKILNGDLRFEYFPGPSEVAAVSLFIKDFTDPIEPVLKPSSDTPVLTYRNARGASLYGVELELRKNLGLLSDLLEDFQILGSAMFAKSSIRVSDTGTDFLTNLNRPLVQSAPHVLNLAFDYENDSGTQARVLYNVSGKRVVSVGTEGLQDGYLQPQHQVDVTASQTFAEHFKVRLNVQNILDAPYVITQGPVRKSGTDDNVMQRYRDGVSASIGVAYTH